MPGGDGTGPVGMGPMTGRIAGFCAGYPVPGYMSPVGGRGFFGRGRGFGAVAAGDTGFMQRGYQAGQGPDSIIQRISRVLHRPPNNSAKH
jgi:hypothetical protein